MSHVHASEPSDGPTDLVRGRVVELVEAEHVAADPRRAHQRRHANVNLSADNTNTAHTDLSYQAGTQTHGEGQQASRQGGLAYVCAERARAGDVVAHAVNGRVPNVEQLHARKDNRSVPSVENEWYFDRRK